MARMRGNASISGKDRREPSQRRSSASGHRSQSAGQQGDGAPSYADQVLQMQRAAGNQGVIQMMEAGLLGGGAGAPARTGMPDSLRSGIESLSGFDLSNVGVHYNSSKPLEVDAAAYAQGSEIHLGPGQEQHLPHEAWHVVQQRQGRVQATGAVGGQALNDDRSLEAEADRMGRAAASGQAVGSAGTARVDESEQEESSGEEALQRVDLQIDVDKFVDSRSRTAQQLVNLIDMLESTDHHWKEDAVKGIHQALATRQFKDAHLAGGYLMSLIETMPRGLMTNEVRGKLEALLNHPHAKKSASRPLELLELFDWKTVPGIRHGQYKSLQWLLGLSLKQGMIGGQAESEQDEQAENEQEEASAGGGPVRPESQPTAYGKIRELLQKYAKAAGGFDQAVEALEQLEGNASSAGLLEEAEELLEQLPDEELAPDPDAGRDLFRLLFRLSGGSGGLAGSWLGGAGLALAAAGAGAAGDADTAAEQDGAAVMERLRQAAAPEAMLKLAREWAEGGKATLLEQAAGRAVLQAHEQIKGTPGENANPDGVADVLLMKAEAVVRGGGKAAAGSAGAGAGGIAALAALGAGALAAFGTEEEHPAIEALQQLIDSGGFDEDQVLELFREALGGLDRDEEAETLEEQLQELEAD